MSESQLVLTALGQDKPGFVKALSKVVLDSGGNITESRMTRLGNEFALIMFVVGSEKVISVVESSVKESQASLALAINCKRTSIKKVQEKHKPYQINVICMDQPGIVHDLTDYIASHFINIETMDTSSYAAAHTGTTMFSLDMCISIPESVNTTQFKNDFLSFCDNLNLDASVEPLKA